MWWVTFEVMGQGGRRAKEKIYVKLRSSLQQRPYFCQNRFYSIYINVVVERAALFLMVVKESDPRNITRFQNDLVSSKCNTLLHCGYIVIFILFFLKFSWSKLELQAQLREHILRIFLVWLYLVHQSNLTNIISGIFTDRCAQIIFLLIIFSGGFHKSE